MVAFFRLGVSGCSQAELFCLFEARFLKSRVIGWCRLLLMDHDCYGLRSGRWLGRGCGLRRVFFLQQADFVSRGAFFPLMRFRKRLFGGGLARALFLFFSDSGFGGGALMSHSLDGGQQLQFLPLLESFSGGDAAPPCFFIFLARPLHLGLTLPFLLVAASFLRKEVFGHLADGEAVVFEQFL